MSGAGEPTKGERERSARISLLAGGTRGDTQPFVALGVALRERGHSVRIAAHENFEEFVTRFGLEFHPLGGDVSLVAGDARIAEAMRTDHPLRMLRNFRILREYAFAMQEDYYHACAGADAVVYHPGAAIGFFAARALGVPSVLASPFPMTPTGAYPALLFYDSVRLGRLANLLTHRIFERTLWLAAAAPVKRFWHERFGAAPDDFASPFGRQRSAGHPTVVSCSEHVFPRPADWPEHVHHTGYWFLDESTGWQPPAPLLAFLAGGPPPVYVGFGSTADPRGAARTMTLVVEALRRGGRRGVLATGWGGMARSAAAPEDSDMYVLDRAPHDWLFPRMAAVVHHGGAGTTAAGLRAGVPTIVVPHANDQFAWGRRVCELGVGPKPVARKKLTAERLAAAIAQASSATVRQAAGALGAKIRSERGAETAAGLIVRSLDANDVGRSDREEERRSA